MKSRFLLHSKLPTSDAATSSRPKSLTRRFELQYNASPRFARRRAARREGQALLLAVLIMLLAALLSAGFLAVVSGNLNQTARIADKTRAIEASRAGIAYANEQLSSSSQGDLWRPVDVSPVPLTTNAAYNSYYSQLDRVQGWALDPATATRDQLYAKFPAPTQAIGDAPKFLVQVKQIPAMLPTGDPETGHAGEIKITSIGLSDDDPNVFATSVAYKVGRRKSPWASALRSVSNWKFGTNDDNTGVPYGKVNAAAAATATVTTPEINVDVQIDTQNAPQFSKSDVPFNVVLVKKDATSTVRGAVVIDVTPPATGSTIATLKLAKVDAPIGTTEVIQKAAAIGTGSTIDLLNTGKPASALPAGYLNFPTQNQSNGILTNGSIWLQGQIQLSDLNKFGTKISSSGSVALDSTSKPVVAPATPPTPNYGIAGSGTLVSSSSNNFPGTFTTDSGANVTPLDIVNDGWNKIGAQTLGLDYSNSRDVEPFEPAKIDSAENLARYRALTRNSAIVSPVEQQGLYIDNRDDVEKVGTAPMTQTQLVNMLLSPVTATENYTRTGTAEPAVAPDKSLEEQHLRGWVGPDEFLPRGALIELMPANAPNFPNPYLRVTLDARADNIAADLNRASGPVVSKSWRNTDGTINAGVYTKTFNWPANGTIFAEGNVRIRGDVAATPAPRSLTVVSMGNIYVEGSLSVDNSTAVVNGNTVPNPDRKKLMLLAKKNVIVNPTRAVIGRTDVQTLTTANGVVTVNGLPNDPRTVLVPVANGLAFNRGDYIVIDGEVSTGDPTLKKIRGLVVATTDTSVSVSTTDTGIIRSANNVIVRSPMEAREAGTNASAKNFYSLVDTERAFNRRIFSRLANPTLNKLLFDHVGELKKVGTTATNLGLKIQADDHTPALIPRPDGFTAVLANKQPLKTGTQDLDPENTVITKDNKVLRTYNNFGNPNNQKDFTNVATAPPNKTLAQFFADIAATQESALYVAVPPTRGYKYTASLTDNSIGLLPYYALAATGLRYDVGGTYTAGDNRRKDFNAPKEVTIPLATSVEFDLNSTLSSLITSTANGATPVNYLGFNPVYNDAEDALTVDSSFYQTKDDVTKSTIDQRVLDLTNPTTFTVPQSVVLKRSNALTTPAISALLPEYRIRALKLENFAGGTANYIRPVAQTMQINAFVYAQEGSWFVIPGDYFRTNPSVRADINASGGFTGSYIDYDSDGNPDVGEYLLSGGNKYADLNRNGMPDAGENAAALRLARYNSFQIQFFGAIVENQTAVVADVKDAAGTTILSRGAVQDWTDKWTAYEDTTAANRGIKSQFKFITYAYDPSIANGSDGADQLRVPLTDDLIYQQ